MSYILLLSNIVLILILGYMRLEKNIIKLSTILYCSTNIIVYYFLLRYNEITNPSFSFQFIYLDIPLLVSIPILISLVLQFKGKSITDLFYIFFVSIISYLSLYFFSDTSVNILSSFEATQIDLLFNSLALNCFIIFSFIMPFTIVAISCERNLISLGIFNFKDFTKHKHFIFKSLGAILLLICVSNMIFKKEIMHIHLYTPIYSLISRMLLYFFYEALVVQFVCFVLVAMVVQKYLDGEKFELGIILCSSAIYTSIFYLSHTPLMLVFDFLIGCLLSLLYLRTKSLTYGLIFTAMFQIFTI